MKINKLLPIATIVLLKDEERNEFILKLSALYEKYYLTSSLSYIYWKMLKI